MQRVVRILLVALALLASSCSGGDAPVSDNAEPGSRELSTPSSSSTTDVPDGLAFVDEGNRTLRVSVPSIDFIAPHLLDETDAVSVLVTDLLTDGLTERDLASGLAVPGLADSWTVSDDRLTWTFQLGDFTFGDGTPITPADVVASLNRVAAEGLDSLSGPNLWPIDGWDAAAAADVSVAGIIGDGESRVQITLTEQFEALPEVLAGATFAIYPEVESDVGTLPTSSSAYFTPTAIWEDGFRVSSDSESRAISTIEIFIDPEQTMLAAGETDLAVGVDPDEPLGDLRGATVQRSADAFFAMNAASAPLDDVMIRQAIVHAVDREAIRAEFFPNAGPMQGFVPQSVPGGSADACGESCRFDVEQARLLVDASPNKGIEFTVDYFVAEGDDDSEQRLAEMVASALREVGLIATARSHTPEDYGARAANGELGVFRFGSVSTTLTAEADLGAMFHTAGRDNLSGTSIERFDALIGAARLEANPVVRASIYGDAERVLFAEAAVLPLAEFRHHLAFTEVLESAGLEPDGSLDLEAIVFASN